MRNTDQRVKAALLGAEKIKRKQSQRRLQALTTVVSLCLVVMIATVVPTLVSNQQLPTATPDFAASIFVSSHALHYIIIGLLSFTLGVCATLLCVISHKKHQEDRDDD